MEISIASIPVQICKWLRYTCYVLHIHQQTVSSSQSVHCVLGTKLNLAVSEIQTLQIRYSHLEDLATLLIIVSKLSSMCCS